VEADDEKLTEPESEVVEGRPPAPRERGQNLPFVLTLVALLAWHGFQTLQLLRERTQLSLAKESQDAAMQESQKVQSQFQTLLTKTSELASQGHAGAKMVMEELQKRGLGAAPAATPVPEAKSPEKVEPKSAEKKPDLKGLK
jgi:hypothetical protein